MFRNQIGPDDVVDVLRTFPLVQDPYGYGWVVEPAPRRQVAVELGTKDEFDAMSPEMIKGSASLLGIWWPPRRPRSRLVLMFVYNEDQLEWNTVLAIARAFAQRWKVVLDDHAGERWLVSPN
jgi:hypothetical protein